MKLAFLGYASATLMTRAFAGETCIAPFVNNLNTASASSTPWLRGGWPWGCLHFQSQKCCRAVINAEKYCSARRFNLIGSPSTFWKMALYARFILGTPNRIWKGWADRQCCSLSSNTAITAISALTPIEWFRPQLYTLSATIPTITVCIWSLSVSPYFCSIPRLTDFMQTVHTPAKEIQKGLEIKVLRSRSSKFQRLSQMTCWPRYMLLQSKTWQSSVQKFCKEADGILWGTSTA